MLKLFAILFGLIMIVIGILGFLPDFAPNGLLLGLFAVNPLRNIVHLLTGVIALVCGLSNSLASKIFFIAFGILYALLAILGFAQGPGDLYGMAINQADNWLHIAIAAVSLYLGFFVRSK